MCVCVCGIKKEGVSRTKSVHKRFEFIKVGIVVEAVGSFQKCPNAKSVVNIAAVVSQFGDKVRYNNHCFPDAKINRSIIWHRQVAHCCASKLY